VRNLSPKVTAEHLPNKTPLRQELAKVETPVALAKQILYRERAIAMWERIR
jgi:hypothetical protein